MAFSSWGRATTPPMPLSGFPMSREGRAISGRGTAHKGLSDATGRRDSRNGKLGPGVLPQQLRHFGVQTLCNRRFGVLRRESNGLAHAYFHFAGAKPPAALRLQLAQSAQ